MDEQVEDVEEGPVINVKRIFLEKEGEEVKVKRVFLGKVGKKLSQKA